ncbi:MAG: hypothetical protein U1E23_03585 [Reyranellaceae bacterium]
MRSFDDFVSAAAPATPLLPLLHVTDSLSLRLVLKDKALKPQRCTVFNENFLYFSYGRPAFRPNAGTEASALSSYAPVCILVDGGKIPLKKVFPFDSGAFHNGLFSKAMHRRMKLESFELAASIDRPQKIVTTFFDTNVKYYDNETREMVGAPATLFEVESFVALLRNKQQEHYDDRVSSIELVTSHAVFLKGNVLAIIFPIIFLEDAEFVKAVEVLNAELLTYPLGARIGNEAIFGQISLLARDFFQRRGLL